MVYKMEVNHRSKSTRTQVLTFQEYHDKVLGNIENSIARVLISLAISLIFTSLSTGIPGSEILVLRMVVSLVSGVYILGHVYRVGYLVLWWM